MGSTKQANSNPWQSPSQPSAPPKSRQRASNERRHTTRA